MTNHYLTESGVPVPCTRPCAVHNCQSPGTVQSVKSNTEGAGYGMLTYWTCEKHVPMVASVGFIRQN